MLVSLIKPKKIRSITLPSKFYGVYWVMDPIENGEENSLISIEAENGNWKLNSNNEVVIVENKLEVQFKYLEYYKFYQLYNKKNKQSYILYCSPVYDETYENYNMNSNDLLIGRNAKCDIAISNSAIIDVHAKLIFVNNQFVIYDNNSQTGVYVNNDRVINSKVLNSGDMIFICGVRIIPIIENDKKILFINNPNNEVKTNFMKLTKVEDVPISRQISNVTDEDAVIYSDSDYFHKRPRFREIAESLNISVDAPPQKAKPSDMPAILTVGPMITSSAISLIYAYMTVSNLVRNGQSLLSSWPTFAVCILSLMATLIWPFIIRRYSKHKNRKIEKNRVQKYNEYIKSIMDTITENANIQKRILISNFPSLEDCKKCIEAREINFWNRKVEDDDFLDINLGIGDIPMQININVPEIHFSLEKDELLEKIAKMRYQLPTLNEVPIVYNFFDKKLTASIGNYELNKLFIDRIIFQLMTFHSYDDLKIVLLTNEIRDKEKRWEYIKVLPHSWNNERSIRFYGVNKDDIREICYYLDGELTKRINNKNNTKKSSKAPFYLIISDSYKTIRNFDFIKKIINLDDNLGFGLLTMEERVFNVPAECSTFINVNSKNSEIFQNNLNAKVQKFNIDFNTQIDMYKYSKLLANIPLEFNSVEGDLVSKIGFLELYDAGKIEQLNVLNRWKNSNTTLSLQALIGLGKGGEKIYLDLHEKYHGPHGLIAGMTGSGKSEFIATYILSLAINYDPRDVQFILIDYKGGGLAGIFENKMTGLKLPHLIGTITNLDENEIKRSLASIDSELKRRQKIFSAVREKLGDSVVDIYKYQQLYKDGIIEEPISHLFIICDEFAELKLQQPEFLQQLISISRIGRSLGIHLILATQKPSGIVDNQIWSNSKFRVCLRVQEKSDSTEVIKCPDAAYLKNAGRFYLQVGYDEVFLLGQAAWAGCRYIPVEKIKKKIDTNVEFVNDIGFGIKKADTTLILDSEINYGEEIKNIISHLSTLAKEENIYNKNLWLNKIPDYINIDELKQKYNFIKEEYCVNIPVGEYDIPSHQSQALLTVPFNTEGNMILYGAAGSGKENFITTLLYSSATSYTPLEVIYYILDFGTQSLKVFNGIPHIGDIISMDDSEKIKNLFKMLFFMIDERKEMFANYNGDYNVFCKNSEEKVPRVIVIINNYDSYSEMYPMFEETLSQLTREGVNFGINFVITAIDPNSVRFKLKQNFKMIYVLQQNNEMDYSNILGNINKNYPSKIFGRGIVKFDDVYEFQTASVSSRDKIFEFIESIKPSIIDRNNIKAINIPVLPKIVTRDNINNNLTQDGSVVIGIERDNLNIVKYDFKNNYTNMILSYDISNIEHFLNPLLAQITTINYFDTIVINCNKTNIEKGKFLYYEQNFDEIFTRLENFVSYNNAILTQNGFDKSKIPPLKPKLCFIIGFDSFKNKLNNNNKNKLSLLFEKGKDLDLINFVIIDNVDKFKKYEFESWYKTVINNTKGIFIGNGLTDQMTIKITKNDRAFREDIPDNFCYVVNLGRPVLVKYVEVFNNNDI